MLPKQPNQSLLDGLACVHALAATSAPTGVRELARTLGFEATRTHRLLRTLAHLGLAEQTADRKYRAGPGIHVLATMSLFASGLLGRAAGSLHELARTGLLVAMGVRWRDQLAYLYHGKPGDDPLQAVARAAPFPASQSGLGLALLAALSESDVRAIYGRRPPPGFASISELFETLALTREQGYADVRRPGADRTLAVVIPTAVPDGPPPTVAIALAGDISDSRVESLVAQLRAAASAIADQQTA